MFFRRNSPLRANCLNGNMMGGCLSFPKYTYILGGSRTTINDDGRVPQLPQIYLYTWGLTDYHQWKRWEVQHAIRFKNVQCQTWKLLEVGSSISLSDKTVLYVFPSWFLCYSSLHSQTLRTVPGWKKNNFQPSLSLLVQSWTILCHLTFQVYMLTET